jgi:23S rRNA (adenine2503-C2)-methyltransferase
LTVAPDITEPFANADLLSLPRSALQRLFVQAGEKPFRAEQLFRWLHVRLVRDLDEMTDLPASLRAKLRAARSLRVLEPVRAYVSSDGSTKHVLRTQAGLAIEAVVMPMAGGHVTECLSSQVGCKMGCDFCATGRLPDRADLTAAEIVEQVAIACRQSFAAGLGRGGVAGGETGPLSGRPHNLVYMGMGEPLDNLQAVIDSLDILCDPKGYDFSPRRITVSTSGLAKRIPALVAAHPHVNLAWSLTATTDEVRDRLMPVNKGVPIQRMVDTLRDLPPSQSRKITLEYAILRGVNDSVDDAARLARISRELDAHANVIPFNAWPGTDYQRPERAVIRRFVDELERAGGSVTLRESKGQDIGAACGQLAGKTQQP